jgi:hypothetical protein
LEEVELSSLSSLAGYATEVTLAASSCDSIFEFFSSADMVLLLLTWTS